MKKQSRSIARKYANALFELYQIPELEGLKDSLFEALRLWEEHAGLRENLLNPALSLHDRSDVLRAIGQKIRPADAHFTNFLVLLLQNKRLADLRSIAEAFSAIIDEVKKVLALQIKSAFELPAAEKEGIARKFQSDYGSAVSIEWVVDPSLIGGMSIKTGDRLLDGSLKGALERLRAELLN